MQAKKIRMRAKSEAKLMAQSEEGLEYADAKVNASGILFNFGKV